MAHLLMSIFTRRIAEKKFELAWSSSSNFIYQLHHSIPSANDKSSINFTFNNQIVQPSTSAKYLGITIDNKLSFKQHIILLENRVACSVGIYC